MVYWSLSNQSYILELDNLENLIKTRKSSGARSDERKSVTSCPLLILGELQELRVRDSIEGDSGQSRLGRCWGDISDSECLMIMIMMMVTWVPQVRERCTARAASSLAEGGTLCRVTPGMTIALIFMIGKSRSDNISCWGATPPHQPII